MISDAFVPCLRSDVARVEIGTSSVVWSPVRPEPTLLDPIATLLSTVIDGDASVSDLIADVEHAVGIPRVDAERQVRRVVELLGASGVLTSSDEGEHAVAALRRRGMFVDPVNY